MRLISLLLILALVSCSGNDNIPKGILKPTQMEPVFWDYMKADVYTSQFFKGDSSRNDTLKNLQMQAAIFKKYNISKVQFENSLNYYLNHPGVLSPMADSIAAHHTSPGNIKAEFKNEPAKRSRPVKSIGVKLNEQSIQ